MFSRPSLHVTLIAVAGLIITPQASGSILGEPSKTPIARQISEFTEDFAVGGMDFSPDGQRLATNATFAGLDVHVWNWHKPSRIFQILHKTAAAGEGNAIRFSNDGAALAVGHARDIAANGFGLIRIWNSQTGQVIHDITEPQSGTGTMALAFSPDGKSFIRTVNHLGTPGNYFVVHDADTWAENWGLSTLPLIARSLAVSPDGQFAAIGGQALSAYPAVIFIPTIAIVDLNKRQITRTIDNVFPDDNQVQTLAWSPDGKAIAAGCIVDGSFRGPNAIRIFDPETGEEIAHQSAENAFISGLLYSPNDKYLIEGQVDRHIQIWDAKHQTLLQSINADMHARNILSISRDGRYLAIAAGSHVSIWELH
jgi:WD40 repeat protein